MCLHVTIILSSPNCGLLVCGRSDLGHGCDVGRV